MASSDSRDTRRRRLKWGVAGVFGLPLFVLLALWWFMIRMPGCSHTGALAALDDEGRQTATELQTHVVALADGIGERHGDRPEALAAAADYVAAQLRAAGLTPRRLPFEADGQQFENIEATLAGPLESEGILVIGAHYDSAVGAPAANDNGSGVAALLVLAKRFAKQRPARELRFVAFANEEPPHFQSERMGSLVYAAHCRSTNLPVVAMLSLETMGYFRDEEGSQKYPFPLNWVYPDRGNFIGFVGDVDSRDLVRRSVASFRRTTPFPSEGAALPAAIPGVGWSDHWSFWQHGYPAVMISDTAPFRYPHYHTAEDTPDKLDYERLARVVDGVEKVVQDLARDL